MHLSIYIFDIIYTETRNIYIQIKSTCNFQYYVHNRMVYYNIDNYLKNIQYN